jgi:hypothetical protein
MHLDWPVLKGSAEVKIGLRYSLFSCGPGVKNLFLYSVSRSFRSSKPCLAASHEGSQSLQSANSYELRRYPCAWPPWCLDY